MKKLLILISILFVLSYAANGFALMPISEPPDEGGGGGGRTLNPTAPIIDNIRSYEFKQSAAGSTEFVAITAKDFDGDDLTLSVNASSFGTYAEVLAPVNSPGYASVVVAIYISGYAPQTGNYVISVAARDGDPHNTQTAEIPVKIIPATGTLNQGIRLNDTLTTYIRVREGQHQEQAIVLEGLQLNEQGYILVAGQIPSIIRYADDGNPAFPHGRLTIDAPQGSSGDKFELVVRALENAPSTHFAEKKVTVEFVAP
ncbi:MAG: hypothetical protein Q8O13_11165 [Candidatus Omnitrophota bacterium]|nr:hypothetical protein [Candidatus Omnitrophota bacterium]